MRSSVGGDGRKSKRWDPITGAAHNGYGVINADFRNKNRKPEMERDVTDVTCDKVTEKSGFWQRRL